MTEFTLGAQELGEVQQSDFAEFISIVTGRSVISGADWGKERIELGLSGDGMVRIFWTPDGLHANFISTTNKDEIPPLMLQILDGEKRISARALEKRLRALRTLYAIVHLSSTDRFNLVQDILSKDPSCDLELLLDDDELLYVECLAPGSWYVTLWSKLRTSYRSVLQTVAIVSERGREALLSKLEAEARLKELEVEEKEFENFTKKVDYGLGLMDRLSTDSEKAALRDRVEEELGNFLLLPQNSNEVQAAKKRLLEEKDKA
jgi:hypothetical protein